MKTAILGGSFNPPHHGHLTIARLAQRKGYRVIAMVSLNPDKKLISSNHRLTMAQLAFKNTAVKVSDFEIKHKIKHTCDSARKLKQKASWIIGSDLLPQIKSWKNGRKLIDQTEFIIVKRSGHTISKRGLEGFKNFTILESKSAISSTQIRELIRKKQYAQAGKLMPKNVMDYILKNKLYEP